MRPPAAVDGRAAPEFSLMTRGDDAATDVSRGFLEAEAHGIPPVNGTAGSFPVPAAAREAVGLLVAALDEPWIGADGDTGPPDDSGRLDAALDELVRALAGFDGAAAELLQLAERSVALRRSCENLRFALTTNRTIAAATGILMALQQLTYDAAFEALLRCSQGTNRKVREVAAVVVETGALPEVPDGR